MLGKLIATQIFAIPAAIASDMALSKVGSVPPYVPLAVWILTSLFVLAKL